jgi:hypothetical protein
MRKKLRAFHFNQLGMPARCRITVGLGMGSDFVLSRVLWFSRGKSAQAVEETSRRLCRPQPVRASATLLWPHSTRVVSSGAILGHLASFSEGRSELASTIKREHWRSAVQRRSTRMDQVLPQEPTWPGVLHQKGTNIGDVDRRSNLTEREFREEYLVPRKPLILTGEVPQWAAAKKWTWEFFRENYGDATAPTGIVFEPQGAMTLRDYADWVEKFEKERGESSDGSFPRYLEGWYFRETHPELLKDFRFPPCFGEDWYSTKFPKRFNPSATGIIFGPTGTFTKLHYDGQSSHNWLAQISGRKKWILIDYDEISSVVKGRAESAGTYPKLEHQGLLEHAEQHEVRYRECITHPGELLVFPSRVFHQVLALEPTISLTHNWFNDTNARRVYWESLLQHMRGFFKRS